MTTVVLLQPRASAEPAWPLGLASIAGVLRPLGARLAGYDLHHDPLEEVARGARGADLLVASVLPHNADEVRDALLALRGDGPRPTVVVGGLATLDPLDALARTGADAAICGHPERAVAALVADPDARPAGTAWRGDAVKPPRQHVRLADLPLPDREVFDPGRYSFAMRSMAMPYAQVFTSRGCDRRCPYCPVPSLHRCFDPRPPAQVAEEFRLLAEGHGVRSVHVEDDRFLGDRERVLAICERLIRLDLELVWELVNGVRPDEVDDELLTAMARGGCRRIVYSFEHVGLPTADGVGHQPEVARRALHMARTRGMRVGGYFIVGLPGVSTAASVASVRRALALGLDDTNFVPLARVQGSAYGTGPTFAPMSSRSAQALATAAQLAFFGRPRPLARLAIDLAREPRTLPALARKAVELARHGGPVPVRDQP